LSRFDFTLKHIPGTKIEKADGLSRRLDWKIGVEKDNKKQIFIKNHWLYSLSEVVIKGPEVNILEEIKIARSKDKKVVRVVRKMKKTGVKMLRGKEWQIKEDLMLKKGKMYMPKNEVLRIEIIQLYHDVLVVGYRGRWKMMELVTRNYYWPEVTRNIRRYVEGCNMCQRMKNRMEAIIEKLRLSKILEKLWTHLMVNFITKLPLVARKDMILIVCNRLSRITYFVATTEGTLAEGLARLFRDNMWRLYRLSESVISDREP